MSEQTLKAQLKADMISAMKAKEAEKLTTLRMLISAIKLEEINNQVELDDDGVMTIINRLVKQRRESIKQFEAGNRPELAAKEQWEIGILANYLPEQLDQATIDKMIDDAITQTGASSMKEMGKVMGILKPKLTGRANMGEVSQQIKAKLS